MNSFIYRLHWEANIGYPSHLEPIVNCCVTFRAWVANSLSSYMVNEEYVPGSLNHVQMISILCICSIKRKDEEAANRNILERIAIGCPWLALERSKGWWKFVLNRNNRLSKPISQQRRLNRGANQFLSLRLCPSAKLGFWASVNDTTVNKTKRIAFILALGVDGPMLQTSFSL